MRFFLALLFVLCLLPAARALRGLLTAWMAVCELESGREILMGMAESLRVQE